MGERMILITGASGHIGSYLVNNLYEVVTLPKKFTEITTEDLKGIDVVIHLAASTDHNNVEEMSKVNIDYTFKFLDMVDESDVELLIFPSTTSIYAKMLAPKPKNFCIWDSEIPSATVVTEEDKISAPVNPYVLSKSVTEIFIKSLLMKTNYVILRLGSVFGVSPGMKFNTAVSKFCHQAVTEGRLSVWKDFHFNYRPYVGLGDVTAAMEIVMANKKTWNQTFNVVTANHDTQYILGTIRQFIDTRRTLTVPAPMGRQNSYKVSCAKIREFGFEPKDSLDQAVKDTLHFLSEKEMG
jgi:nucleoside-diphosphate-sugar epimerase